MKRSDDGSDKLGRRELLRRGALAGVTAGLLPFTGGRAARAEAQATVKRYAPWAAPGSRIRHSRESGNDGEGRGNDGEGRGNDGEGRGAGTMQRVETS